MKAIQRFSAMHPLSFVILATVAWIVTGLAAAYLVAGALQASLADELPQSLGTLAATVCLLLVMWRWGWLLDPSVPGFAVATAAELPLVIAGLWLLLRNTPGSIPTGARERGAEAFTSASSLVRLLLLLFLVGTLSLASSAGETTPTPAQPPKLTAAIAAELTAAERTADPHGCTV
ncbi:MAG: hypothetical protein ACP5JJ_18355, partial [Anaerolineae bacterium]